MTLCPLALAFCLAQPEPDPLPKPKPDKWHTIAGITAGFSIEFSPDGKLMAVGDRDGPVIVREVPGGKISARIGQKAVAVAFTADGKRVVTASTAEGTICTWDLDNGKQTNEVELPRAKDLEWVIGFSPGGTHLALRLKESFALVETRTGKVAAEIEVGAVVGGGFPTGGGAFSPDGKRFAGAAADSRFAVWDVATGKQIAIREKKEWDRAVSGQFAFIAYSPDGRWVATGNGGSVNQPIQIWDAATAELLAEPLKIEGYTCCLAWTPDGAAVVTTDYGGVVATSVATGKMVHRFEHGGGNLWGYVIRHTPDGRYLAFRGSYGTGKDGKPDTFNIELCEMPEPRKPGVPKADLNDAELDFLWADVPKANKIRREQIATAMTAAAKSAVPYLAKRAAGRDEPGALAAVELLERIGTPDARTALEAIAGAKEDRVAQGARAALEKRKAKP